MNFGSVFGQINRREQSQGTGDAHGDGADQGGAGQKRDRTKTARSADLIGTNGGLRAPLKAEQEIAYGHGLEETDRFEKQRGDDTDGR